MIEVLQKNDHRIIQLAMSNTCNTVYPLSIAENYQEGQIFVDSAEHPKAALFWHYCGFAYISGNPDHRFLSEVSVLITGQGHGHKRRFILMVNDTETEAYFSAQADITREERFNFELAPECGIWPAADIPDGYAVKEMNADLLSSLSGNIIPSFSWASPEEFLKKGKGYCVMHDNNIAAAAFTAAVCHNAIDIGIETNPLYRRRGLGIIAARRMVQYAAAEQKKPLWACHVQNTGSRRTAEEAGFRIVSVNPVFKKI